MNDTARAALQAARTEAVTNRDQRRGDQAVAESKARDAARDVRLWQETIDALDEALAETATGGLTS